MRITEAISERGRGKGPSRTSWTGSCYQPSATVTLSVYGHLFRQTDDQAAQVIETAMATASTE
jgi:hypothetical protein